MSKLKIKTGDQVLIIAGKDAGKKGKVLQVLPAERRVVVENINQMTKNVRARRERETGQRVQFNGPIHISNVMLIDPKSGEPTRVGSTMVGDKKVRRSVRRKEPLS
ncbi:MAG: 50S ribosomal protein L24 [Candidatus Kerfeldbacteria bacterium]|nr:50S ribosomal protein L24 [Candidatus Kerfeldbacteria bacterium]